MSRTAAVRTKPRRTLRRTAVGLVVVIAGIIGTFAYQATSLSADSLIGTLRGNQGPTTEVDGAITEDDGALPDGVSVFDDRYPGVTNVDPELLQALREAATDAPDVEIEFQVNSGWRSAKHQDQLLWEAISTYGSEEEAVRWVATPHTSAHVSGDAVDIGSFDATAWLSEHGAEYGLCQIHANEPWHYELRPAAIDRSCPSMYADPTRAAVIE